MSVNPHLPKMSSDGFSTTESLTVALGESINGGGFKKWLGMFWAKNVSSRFVRLCSQGCWEVKGLEEIRNLQMDAGVLLIANHRSFYDLYVVCGLLFHRSSWLHRVYFPVRSYFWYTTISGVIVNLLMAGGAMWPPIFRDRSKLRMNKIAISQLAHVLAKPGAVIGFHPEGTRNTDSDPMTFLPAQVGLGKLIKESHDDVTIVPVYINGLSNSFWAEMIRNVPWRKSADDEPIRMYFGEPVRIGDLPTMSPRKVSQYLMDKVAALSVLDPRHPEYR